MPKIPKVSVRDLEQEADRLFAPVSEKERAILEAASALIGERGIDGATTAEIARRAKVTERTLFRYFPSKADLVRRILYPAILHSSITRQWQSLEILLKTDSASLKNWFTTAASERLASVSKTPELAHTVLVELMRNDELRSAMSTLWQQHVWKPMLEHLAAMKKRGDIRREVDIEMLARAMHCLHVGYFLTRHVFAPDREWDDASEIGKLADLLAHGAAGAARKSRAARRSPRG